MKRLFFISLLFIIAASSRANVNTMQVNDTIYGSGDGYLKQDETRRAFHFCLYFCCRKL